MPTRTESMATPPTRPLHQSESGADNLIRGQCSLRLRHLGGAYCECVGSTIIQQGKSGSAHDLQLRSIVRASRQHHSALLDPHANTHLISDSACITSIFRLVKFAQNQPTVEGAVDVTWDYYSLNLLRYTIPCSISALACLRRCIGPPDECLPARDDRTKKLTRTNLPPTVQQK